MIHSFEIQQADVLLEIFDNINKLELQIDISEAQNIYFSKIYHKIGDIIESGTATKRSSNKKFIEMHF